MQQSRKALAGLFEKSLDRDEGMPPRMVDMMAYLVQHDTDHRGQTTMLARALGHRLSKNDVMRLWGWKKLP